MRKSVSINAGDFPAFNNNKNNNEKNGQTTTTTTANGGMASHQRNVSDFTGFSSSSSPYSHNANNSNGISSTSCTSIAHINGNGTTVVKLTAPATTTNNNNNNNNNWKSSSLFASTPTLAFSSQQQQNHQNKIASSSPTYYYSSLYNNNKNKQPSLNNGFPSSSNHHHHRAAASAEQQQQQQQLPQLPQKHVEQFHTKTTTLRSNKDKEPLSSSATTEYYNNNNNSQQQQLRPMMEYSRVTTNGRPVVPPGGGAGFQRRHTAAGVHEFAAAGAGPLPPAMPPPPPVVATSAAMPTTAPYLPTYHVEHLASFAVGKQFGLVTPSDGVRKLKQMERNSAICPIPMLFTLHPDRVAVLEQNGTLVEEFPMRLIADPTAHTSSDPVDLFNNVLLFVVREHDAPNGTVPTEMHIFQCLGLSAQTVAEDLHHYTRGHFHKVAPGRRGQQHLRQHEPAWHPPPPPASTHFHYQQQPHSAPSPAASLQQHQQQQQRHQFQQHQQQQFRDDVSSVSDNNNNNNNNTNNAELFEMDVNTLNRCFDDIERFVARIQSAAMAQRELELQSQRQRGSSSSKKKNKEGKKNAQQQQQQQQNSILQLRSQMASPAEFAEVFQKFKLCFNLLAKLRNHIHEPSAPELLHFLFTPLMVILDACQWGLNRQIAQEVYSPLLSLDACELLRSCLYPKEMEVWIALGRAWNTPAEEWPGPLPPPYHPVFLDGFAPYGYPAHHHQQQQQLWASRWATNGNGTAGAFNNNNHVDGGTFQQQQHSARYSSAPPPIHRGASAPAAARSGPPPPPQQQQQQQQMPSNYYAYRPPPQPNPPTSLTTSSIIRHIDDIELERINLEKERLEFERRKVLDKERELLEQERRLRDEAEKLEQEKRQLHRESEKRSIAESDRPDFYRGASSTHGSPRLNRRAGSVQVLSNGQHYSTMTTPPYHQGTMLTSPRQQQHKVVAASQMLLEQNSPRQKAFLEDLIRRGCKIVQATYDRNACNPKELTVVKGEYLEVLNDTRNWWECRNVHSRSGFVPHTILSVLFTEEEDVEDEDVAAADDGGDEPDWQQQQENGGERAFAHQRDGGGGGKQTRSTLDRNQQQAQRVPPPATTTTERIFNEQREEQQEGILAKIIPMQIRQRQEHVPDIMASLRRHHLAKKCRRVASSSIGSAASSSPQEMPSVDANNPDGTINAIAVQYCTSAALAASAAEIVQEEPSEQPPSTPVMSSATVVWPRRHKTDDANDEAVPDQIKGSAADSEVGKPRGNITLPDEPSEEVAASFDCAINEEEIGGIGNPHCKWDFHFVRSYH